MEVRNTSSCAKCGSSINPEASFCQNCGAPIRSEPRPTPRPNTSDIPVPGRRQVNRVGRFILVVAFLIFLILVLDWSFSASNRSGTASSNTSSTVSVQLPPSEVAFISTVTPFEERYGKAANEYQKSALRSKRAQALAAILPSLSVENWVGQISSMTTTSDGNGTISVVLPGSQIKVVTDNNSLSASLDSDNTLIPQGSQLYNDLANLAQGDTVFFSGSFLPSDANQLDYIEELSLTEEGSMTEPAFLFRFVRVEKQSATSSEKPSPYVGSGEQGAESTTPQESSQQADVIPAPVAPPASATKAAPAAATMEPVTSDERFKPYANRRFGFSIDYPQSFVAKNPPVDGDGIELASSDGSAILVASGSNNPGFDLAKYYEIAVQSVKGDLGYRRVASDWFVVSWRRRDRIVYQKTFVGKGSENSFTFSYPFNQRAEYGRIVVTIEKSFCPGDLRQSW